MWSILDTKVIQLNDFWTLSLGNLMWAQMSLIMSDGYTSCTSDAPDSEKEKNTKLMGNKA